MRPFQKAFYSLHPLLLASIASVLTVAQIVLAFFLHGGGSEALKWAGWICVWTSGIFGILPIITFRRKGGVPKGESYMKTTVLVDKGAICSFLPAPDTFALRENCSMRASAATEKQARIGWRARIVKRKRKSGQTSKSCPLPSHGTFPGVVQFSS